MFDFTPFDSLSQDEPIARIADTLIVYALQDGAREIHVQSSAPNRGVSVLHRAQSDEPLREMMKIPAYVYSPLRARLQHLDDERRTYKLNIQSENCELSRSYRVEMSVQNGETGETVVLKLIQSNRS